ncbi:MAG: TIGR02300 family protein [Pseudomonadota bacterium]|jgi:uncharacterized protein (TIGR02300 family)
MLVAGSRLSLCQQTGVAGGRRVFLSRFTAGKDHRASPEEEFVAKPEWGTKRQCPACGARFYDLGNADPVVCIKCSHSFAPEVLLKPRRGRPDDKIAESAKASVPDDDEEELEDSDLDTVSLDDLESDVEDEDADVDGIGDLPDVDLNIDEDGDDSTLLDTDEEEDEDILPKPSNDD